jgi:hypothetical protein
MNEHDPSIDWVSFAAHIKLELRRSNILIGELPVVVKLNRRTISQAANERQCSAEVYIALCLWMGMRPTRFFCLGPVPENFYLFKTPDDSSDWEGEDAEPRFSSSLADCRAGPGIASDQPMLPGSRVRGIRGRPPRIGGPSIDWTAFAETLHRRMDRFNISLRDLQSSSGVHYSTLSRVANGKQCLAVTYMTLCAWMMLVPTKFYQSGSP